MEVKKLRLLSEPVSFKRVRTIAVQVAYDDELDAFYTVLDDGTLPYSLKELPANFVTHELLDVDPDNLDSLLGFMNEWGIVTSSMRVPFRPNRVGSLKGVIATPTKGGNEADMEAAVGLLDKLDARHPGLKRGYNSLLARVDVLPIYPFAPRGEVEGSVRYLQEKVNRLTRAAFVGYDAARGWSDLEEIQLRAAVDAVDEAISPYFPRFVIALDDVKREATLKKGQKTKLPAPIVPLSIAVQVQLMDYLMADEAFRICRCCGKLFVYKRRSDGEEGVRSRSSSIYCSDPCKAIASFTAQNAKRKKKRRDDKEAAARLAEEGR